MNATKVVVEFPFYILGATDLSSEEFVKIVKSSIAVQLYLDEKISIGRAVEIAEMNRLEFENHLAEKGHPISLLTFKDVLADVEKLR